MVVRKSRFLKIKVNLMWVVWILVVRENNSQVVSDTTQLKLLAADGKIISPIYWTMNGIIALGK